MIYYVFNIPASTCNIIFFAFVILTTNSCSFANFINLHFNWLLLFLLFFAIIFADSIFKFCKITRHIWTVSTIKPVIQHTPCGLDNSFRFCIGFLLFLLFEPISNLLYLNSAYKVKLGLWAEILDQCSPYLLILALLRLNFIFSEAYFNNVRRFSDYFIYRGLIGDFDIEAKRDVAS